MNLALTLENVRKCINEVVKKDRRKMLFFCLMIIASVFIGVVGAAVYNLMYMQGSIGVEVSLFPP